MSDKAISETRTARTGGTGDQAATDLGQAKAEWIQPAVTRLELPMAESGAGGSLDAGDTFS